MNTPVSQTSNFSPNSHIAAPKQALATSTTQQEQKQLDNLKARDREVRSHEAAHIAAGAGLVKGSANYSYQRGPDGNQYAIGGEVQIDTSPIAGNPEATLKKAENIRRAALAPASPSSQDRIVAAQAAQMAIQARAELNTQASTASSVVKESYSSLAITYPKVIDIKT